MDHRIYIKRKNVGNPPTNRRTGNTETLVRFVKKHARHYDRVIVSCVSPHNANEFRRRVGNDIHIDTHVCYVCSQGHYPSSSSSSMEKCLYIIDDFDYMQANERLNCMVLAQRVEANGGTCVILNE